jgi:hypothetical protein
MPLAFACTKEQITKPGISKPQVEQAAVDNTLNRHKSFEINRDFDFGGETGCGPGTSNCTSFCCVTSSALDDYMDAIDGDNESNFLTTDMINTLSNGDQDVKIVLNKVRDGYLEATYINNTTRVAFLYGENVSETNYEYAHVIDKQ